MTDTTPPGDQAADPNAPGSAEQQGTAAPGWPVAYPMAYQPAAAQAGAPLTPTPGDASQDAGAPPQYPQVTPYPAYPSAPAAPQTSSGAIVALVLAIASWAVCPLVLAIIALVFASKADREIAASAGRIAGGGLSTAAKIVAWVNIGVFVAVTVIIIFVVIIAVIAGGLSQVTPTGQV